MRDMKVNWRHSIHSIKNISWKKNFKRKSEPSIYITTEKLKLALKLTIKQKMNLQKLVTCNTSQTIKANATTTAMFLKILVNMEEILQTNLMVI